MVDAVTEQKLPPARSLAAVDLLNPQKAMVLRERSHEYSPDYSQALGIHFKFNGTDGVSLEGQKLRSWLNKHGVHTRFCSGDISDKDIEEGKGKRIEGLNYQSREMEDLRARVFAKNIDPKNIEQTEQNLLGEIYEKSLLIQEEIENYINENNIGIVHIRNLFSLPLDLPASIAAYRIMLSRPELLFVMHHHDFIWEGREDKFTTQFPEIRAMLNAIYPPRVSGPKRKHIVISKLAQKELMDRRGIVAEVVPDSIDMENPPSAPNTAKKQELWKELGIAENDMVIGVMSRILPRKGIELAIQMAAEIQRQLKDSEFQKKIKEQTDGFPIHNGKLTKDSNVVLLMAQKEDLKDNIAYYRSLQAYAKELGVTIIFGGHRISAQEGETSRKRKVHPFYDVYSYVNAVIYPSKKEGFGNQLLEIIWAKILPVVLEYPVFVSDIKDALQGGYISLGDTSSLEEIVWLGVPLSRARSEIVERATRELIDSMIQPKRYHEQVEANSRSIKQLFDIKVVGARFNRILGKMREAALVEKLEHLSTALRGQQASLISLARGRV